MRDLINSKLEKSERIKVALYNVTCLSESSVSELYKERLENFKYVF